MKKSILLILSMTLLVVFANAQITIMPYVQGGMSYRTTPQKNYFQIGSVKSDISRKPTFGFGSGLLINYQFNEKLEIRTGIEYQNAGIKQEIKYKTTDPNYAFTFTFVGIVGNVNRVKLQTNSTYINIPLQAQYNLKSIKNTVPYIALGTNFSWFVQDNSFAEGFLNDEFVGETSYKSEPNNVWFTGVNLDFGIQQKINERFAFNAFVSGDIILSRIGKYSAFSLEYQPYNVSLGIGLAYSILGK
jgi:hypothetical protein